MVVEAAIAAAGHTLLFVILGRVALSITGGLLRDKIPSPPPGFEWPSIPFLESGWAWLMHYRLWILWTIFFGFGMGMRLRKATQDGTPPGRWARAAKRLSENWFGIFVGNAIGASFSAGLVLLLSHLSLENWVFKQCWNAVAAALSSWTGPVTDVGFVSFFKSAWHWFTANQLSFTFWSLFLAAILDDLGLPNLKTWGRLLWRRVRPRKRPAVAASSQVNSGAV
jgi:hypothetical protein